MVRECFSYVVNGKITATKMTNHEYTEYKQPVVAVTSEEEEGFMVIKEGEDFWMDKVLFNKLFSFSGEHITDGRIECPCNPVAEGDLIIHNHFKED